LNVELELASRIASILLLLLVALNKYTLPSPPATEKYVVSEAYAQVYRDPEDPVIN
jgi:hypothetical protein